MTDQPWMVEFTVPGNPVPKARPRVTMKAGQKPRAYTPKRTKFWESQVQDAAKAAMQGRNPLEGPLGVELWLYRSDKRRVDADNMEKAILDACNKIVWLDDCQVVNMNRYKRYDRRNPRAIVRVWTVATEGLAW